MAIFFSDAEFSGSDSEGTFLRRKSATDDLVGVFAGSGRIQRRGSRKGKRSSTKEVNTIYVLLGTKMIV